LRARSERSAGLAIGSDGRRVVAVDRQCEGECQLRVSVSDDDRTGWTRAPQLLPVNEPYATFTAGKFILSGSIEDNDGPGHASTSTRRPTA